MYKNKKKKRNKKCEVCKVEKKCFSMSEEKVKRAKEEKINEMTNEKSERNLRKRERMKKVKNQDIEEKADNFNKLKLNTREENANFKKNDMKNCNDKKDSPEKKRVKWSDESLLYKEEEKEEDIVRGIEAETDSNSLKRLFTNQELEEIEKGDFIGEEDNFDSELEEKLYPERGEVNSNCILNDFSSSRRDEDFDKFADNNMNFIDNSVNFADNNVFEFVNADQNISLKNENTRVDDSEERMTEEDWLKWFDNEILKGHEQVKAKTIRTEVNDIKNEENKKVLNNDCMSLSEFIKENKEVMFIEGDFMNMRAVGSLEGLSTPILIDTGAGHSMISRELWIKLGRPKLKKIQTDVKWQSASGHQLNILGMTNVHFELGIYSEYIDFTVAEDLSFDCILGIDLLYNMGVVINVGRKRIVFPNGKDSIPVSIYKSCHCKKIFNIKSKRKIKLLPNHRQIIRGTVQGENLNEEIMLIEKDKEKKCSVHIANCLSIVKENNEVYCEIFNPTGETVEINSLDIIAKGEIIPKKSFKTSEEYIKQNQNADVINTVVSEETEEELFEVNFEKSGLNQQQKERLIETLKSFKEVFVNSSKAPGRTNLVKFEIDTEEHKPIRNSPYRISKHESDIMEKEIKQYLELGLIRTSNSPWSSPVLMIRKPDGGIRFCIDYRKLNNITVKDSYPLPRIDDLLDVLGGATYFSSMDIASGYWNVPMEKNSIPKTAFTCKFGLYEWVVMPFGLTNAPACFQKLMDEVLRDLKWKICLVYLDDCVVFSQDFDSHLIRLKQILKRFLKAGFKLKLKKCHWGRNSIPFLGHLVTNRGILPNPAKVITVMKAKAPTDVSSLRSFTGLTSYFRRFIKGYANISAPLEKLKQKSVKWYWSDDCQEAFDILKRKLCSPPILAYPRWDLEFELHTDASMHALGTVLCQKQDKRLRVIAYGGRVTSKTEKKYGITELECLAMVYGVKKFRCYLEGRKFLLVTDHSALVWLFKQGSKTNNRMLMRWVIELQSYNFKVQYRQGIKHGCADGISRMLREDENDNTMRGVNSVCLRSGKQYGNPESTQEEEIQNDKTVNEELNDNIIKLKKNQIEEKWMKPIVLFLSEKAIPTDPKIIKYLQKRVSKFMLDENGILMREIKYSRNLRNSKKKFVICIPFNMCEEVLEDCHDNICAGHSGRTKTWERVRERFYWPGMYKDVKDYVSKCHTCMQYKGERQFNIGTRQRMPIDDLIGPFDFIVADAIGPLPTTKSKNKYIITITDYFSRWAEAIPVADLKSSTWLRVVQNEIFYRHGIARRLLTDQGGNFISILANCFYDLIGVKKLTSTAYHPETQGLDERFNGTLIRILKMYINQYQNDWDIKLPAVLFSYRTAYHESLGDTPFYILYGRDARMPSDVKFLEGKVKLKQGNLSEYRRKVILELQQSRELVHSTLKKVQDKILKSNKSIKRRVIIYQIGEPVWLYCYFRKNNEDDQRISKLATKWHGPYRIHSQISSNVYRLSVPHISKKIISVNVNRLKKFNGEWNKPLDEEYPDGIVEDELLNEENFTVADLPETSFVHEIVTEDEEKVLKNVVNIVIKIVAKRIIQKSDKKVKQYLLLLADGDYLWKDASELGMYQLLIKDFEEINAEREAKPKLRRSKRVKELDYEAGLSRVYFD